VSELSEDHIAQKFAKRRHLPTEFEFHYAEKFVEWSKGNTDKFATWKGLDHPRVIIPWRDRTSKIIGYSARDLSGDQDTKYYRIFVDESVKERLFGADRLDDSIDHYVLEGEIDSLMIPNAIAMSNGKLHTYLHKNAIYIPDCDRRNPHIMKNVSDMIDLGLRVCLLPDSPYGKDLNELVVHGGLTSDDLLRIIQGNVVQGLSGKLKFNQWKKV
jgi:hypothetical protein